jgi:hypothetical protein
VGLIDRLKAILRAWLIDLVREAIRLELSPEQAAVERPMYDPFATMKSGQAKPASKPVTALDPTDFAQMLDVAIQRQEKYYEAERL